MSKFLVTISLLFSCSVSAKTSWEIYLDLPTSENALKVSSIEYSKNAIPEGYGYLSRDLEILKIQVLSGDRNAFLLTFKLRSTADGGLLEELTAILASSIRPQPEAFLTAISVLKPSEDTLRRILQMSGLEYTDRLDAKKYEMMQRAIVINSVDNSALESIKQKCLLLLN